MHLLKQTHGPLSFWCLAMLFHVSKEETESLKRAEEDFSVSTFKDDQESSQDDPGDPPNHEIVSVRNLRDLIVEDLGIVKALPLSVLNKIAKDPLFAVNVVPNMTEEIRMFLKTITDDQEDEDYIYSEDSYYNVDYGDYVGNFLEGLDPAFFASISPDLLLAYFESATVEDIKSILADSTILLSLPPNTVVELLKKLPGQTVDVIVNSDAVCSLYSSVQVNFI